MHRLRIVVRADLPPGPLAAQAVHAAMAWQVEHPELARSWMETSNTVAILASDDLDALKRRARDAGIALSRFEEPDLGGLLTALALAPGREARRICNGLPRAGLAVEGGDARPGYAV